MSTKSKIKVENFKIGKDTSSQINAGLIILISGLILLSLPMIQLVSVLSIDDVNTYPTLLGEIQNIVFYIGSNIFFFGSQFLILGALGWGIGGFLAAILYGNEGKNAPLYASYILARFVAGLLITIIPFLIISQGEISAIILIAILPIIVLVLSLPLILISALSYRVGLWISPSMY